MVMVALLATWLAMVAAKGTPLGASMRRWLVEKPGAALARIRRGAVLTVALLCLLGGVAFLLLGHEGAQLFGMAAPELAGMLAMIDLGVVLDIAVVAVAAASTGGWRAVRVMGSRLRHRARTVRARRVRVARKPAANDDDGAAGLALAA